MIAEPAVPADQPYTQAGGLAWRHVMEKRIGVGLGNGKVKVFRTKRGFLRWLVTTRAGWKYLGLLLLWLPMLPILIRERSRHRADLDSMMEEAKQKWASPR
jgi:hypothetical protein